MRTLSTSLLQTTFHWIRYPSDSHFLFAEERGYHKWALAHSSSCFFLNYTIKWCIVSVTFGAKHLTGMMVLFCNLCCRNAYSYLFSDGRGTISYYVHICLSYCVKRRGNFVKLLYLPFTSPHDWGIRSWKRFLTRQIPISCLPKSGGYHKWALAHSSSWFFF
jgi:hypothetical protein